MTKNDYMNLSKERLAELLAEKDKTIDELRTLLLSATRPLTVQQFARPLCYEEGGTCMNPQMDCVNCPRHGYTGRIVTVTGGVDLLK